MLISYIALEFFNESQAILSSRSPEATLQYGTIAEILYGKWLKVLAAI